MTGKSVLRRSQCIVLFLLALNIDLVFGHGLITVDDLDRYDDLIRVQHEDAAKSVHVLKMANVTDFRPMVIDNERKQILVGARDLILRLSTDSLEILERFDWPASASDISMCQIKGQTEADCHNFIRVMALRDDRVLICGTNAYYPSCTWRKATELNFDSKDHFNGIGYAPYSPHYSNTYVMTWNGDLYTGVVTDFAGHDSSLLRMIPSNKILRTPKSNSRWLNDPSFVAALEIGNFIYYFFRESALEASHCGGQPVYSRVGRVCKNDAGGDILLQDQWTTFTKARLNCSYSNTGASGPFEFNYLQSVYFVPEHNLLYTVFTTSDTHLHGSAICVYNLESLQKAFSGPYRHQSSPNSYWQTETNSDPDFSCQIKGAKSDRPSITTRSLTEAQKFQLMDWSVQPIFNGPLENSILEKYTHIVVDTVALTNRAEVHVAFVISGRLLKKYSLTRPYRRACLVEVIEMVPKGQHMKINEMKLIKDLGVIVVSTNDHVLKINVQRCHRYKNRQQCLDAKDPYCGWDTQAQRCTATPSQRTNSGKTWEQNTEGCDNAEGPVNGQFGEWSKWFSCPRMSVENKGETCQCRQRICNSPKPRNGGAVCAGPTTQVSNCTQHGGWTSWSDWSACTKTCGNAVRTRTRDCSNPAPAFGGLVCVGSPIKMETCDLPACPEPTPPPVNGGWSQWTDWESCSKSCNGGAQKRSRACDNPSPAYGGRECGGCHVEHRPCNIEQCSELRRWSAWTAWLQSNITGSGGLVLKRFRVACDARVENAGMLTMTNFRSEERICSQGGTDCTDSVFRSVDGGWSDWSDWSACTQSCGSNGTQWRIRTCSKPAPVGNGLPCTGHAKEYRQCNVVPCEASWSCWSDYTECSVTCGTGYRQRIRNCIQSSHGSTNCVGERVQSISCDAGPCSGDGYAEWTGWSICNEFGLKVRIRSCLLESACHGVPDAQMKRCYEKTNSLESRSPPPSDSKISLILGVIFAFIGGILIACLVIFFINKRRARRMENPPKLSLATLNGHTGNPKQPRPPKMPPPEPTATKSNIYTPPPSLRNVHPVPNITLNPINRFSDYEGNDYEGLSDQEATLTLKRTMRTSLNTKDYL